MKTPQSILVGAIALALPVYSASTGTCQTGYTVCAPAGATSMTSPSIGSSQFTSLLQDLLSSSLPPLKKRDDGTASLCCVSSLSCLTLANLALPFCYDKFTTNFVLPDNSFGTVATGAYSSSSGDKANLITGDYTLANGQSGNIYASNAAAKPNTATLVLPAQFTASGVGSAIPATALGGWVTHTYTTTLPGSTIPGTTISPTTISGSVISSVLVVSSTISSTISNSAQAVSTASVTSTTISTAQPSTVPGTTKSESVVPGTTAVITTTEALPASSSAATTTSKKSAAGKGNVVNIAGSLALVMAAIFICLV